MEPKEQEALLDTVTDKGGVARPQPYWQRVGQRWIPGLSELAGTAHDAAWASPTDLPKWGHFSWQEDLNG